MDGETSRMESLERHVSELRHDLDRAQQRGRRQHWLVLGAVVALATTANVAPALADGSDGGTGGQAPTRVAPYVAAGSITTSKLRNGAVTTPKLHDGAVTSRKVANGSLTGTDVKNGSLTGADVRNGSIGASDLAGSVIRPKAVGHIGEQGAELRVRPSTIDVEHPATGFYCLDIPGVDAATSIIVVSPRYTAYKSVWSAGGIFCAPDEFQVNFYVSDYVNAEFTFVVY